MENKDLNYNVSTPIANVIQIPDKYTIIIDKGFENADIKEGSKLEIYEPGPIIEDLDGNKLGVYDFTKAKVVIKKCYQYFSICKNEKVEESDSSAKLMSPLFSQKKYYYAAMNVEENEVKPLQPNNPKIKIGDLVKYR